MDDRYRVDFRDGTSRSYSYMSDALDASELPTSYGVVTDLLTGTEHTKRDTSTGADWS
jgi:hypothetical protein